MIVTLSNRVVGACSEVHAVEACQLHPKMQPANKGAVSGRRGRILYFQPLI